MEGLVNGSPILIEGLLVGFVGGESPVADAAQWIWMNRERVTDEMLMLWPSTVIERAARACKRWDAEKDRPNTYTLEDLRKAYKEGFIEGCERKNFIELSESEQFIHARDEALRAIK